jgi:putative ABC transport system ATP-binding protein
MTTAEGAETLVRLQQVVKSFRRGGETLTVLDGLDMEIPRGSFEALMGPSGSGKSTLLNLIAGLDRATSGKVIVAGSDLGAMSDGELAAFRARHLGFIFQSYNLMPVLTAAENVELPLLLTKLPRAERRKRALIALRVVGLEDRTDHYPGSSPAARSSAWPSRGPSSTTRPSSSPTSPRATSTARAPTPFSTCS